MTTAERKALEAYARRIEDAAMKFSVEVFAAGGDLRRMLDGEEPIGPRFVSRQQAVQEHYAARGVRQRGAPKSVTDAALRQMRESRG